MDVEKQARHTGQSSADDRCFICEKHISELEEFEGAGDWFFGDFSGMKLVETTREDFPGYFARRWECRDCIIKAGGVWELLDEKRLGRELTRVERIKMRYELELDIENMNSIDVEKQVHEDLIEMYTKFADRLSAHEFSVLLHKYSAFDLAGEVSPFAEASAS